MDKKRPRAKLILLMKRTRDPSSSLRTILELELTEAEIDDLALIEEICERHFATDDTDIVPLPPLDKCQRHELALLCHVYCDLKAVGVAPVPPLKAFLTTYLSESRDTVTVESYVEGGSFTPDRVERDSMPFKALEFLRLVNPVIQDLQNGRGNVCWGEVEFKCSENGVRPALVSIPPAEWLTHKDSKYGFWLQEVEEHDKGASYVYFLEHYTDKDRDEKTRALWKSVDKT